MNRDAGKGRSEEVAELIRRSAVASDINGLYAVWQKDTEKAQGFSVTCHQQIEYFRNALIEAVWRRWPR